MKRLILLSAFMLGLLTAVMAAPAYRGAIRATQPDGTVITFYLHGDENGHECVTPDGYRLLQDAKGAYRYARQTADLQLTVDNSPLAHDPLFRNSKEKQFVKTLKPAKDFTVNTTATRRNAHKQDVSRAGSTASASRFQIGSFPTSGKRKCLVLLAEYTDVKFTLSHDYHNRMLNEVGFSDDGATGSAHDFYYAQSGGQFDPQFDVVGPITLPHNMAYYGENNSFTGRDDDPAPMISDACQIAYDKKMVDFSQYDSDNDGMVDMVYVIYAGYGENAGGGVNTVWPHKFSLHSQNINMTLNNKVVDVYACSAELFGAEGTQSAGIGTVCHEFGHVLGLADHYNTSNSSDYLLGAYDIMDYGSYNNEGRTPAGYNAFERMSLGWLTPKEITDPADGVALSNISDNNEAYILKTTNEDEFYLLENRQKSGWDAYLPASGMMITHVDFSKDNWKNNVVNNVVSHPGFSIIPADSEPGYDVVLKKETEKNDLYPALGNNSFTDNSKPIAKPWTGETLDKWITNITNADGIVTFDYKANHLKTPLAAAARIINDNSFEASWNKVDKADTYTVNLYKLDYRSAQKNAIDEDMSLMTAGTVDAPDKTNIETILDNYTTTDGWTGSNVYQAGGWCRIGTANASGSLTTPALNMKRYDGNFAVAVTVKSMVGKSPVFSVSANGLSGKTRINSVARTYLFQFSGGISTMPVTLAVNSERAMIDKIVIVRGDDAAQLFPDAKAVSVTGEPAVVEGDVEDNDFVHVDTLTVTDISGLSYTFTSLQPQTYYAFSVKAISDESVSAFSAEQMAYMDLATSIDAVKPDTATGITEIYTIDGRRVNSMSHRGIYIIKQGNKVRKVIKK